MRYEILKCNNEYKRTDVEGNIIPFELGGDPDCSSPEEIETWTNGKILGVIIIDKKIDFKKFGESPIEYEKR